MQIKVAKHAGFCFGVQRAVEGAQRLAQGKKPVYTLGELIHNRRVIEVLEAQGIHTVKTPEELAGMGAIAVIRSHGVGPEIYERLNALNIEHVDLTCPFVTRIHKRVAEASGQYDGIIIVGSATHPEVVGIKGWAGSSAHVIGSPEEIADLPELDTVLVVSQTTITRSLLESVFSAVKARFPKAELFDSICETTALRQQETAKLAANSDAVIVVGDPKSSNTSKLFEISSKFCKKTQYIESYQELFLEKFKNYDIISIVAGASTPDWIIREVQIHMSEFEQVQATETVQPDTLDQTQNTEETVAVAEGPVAEATAAEAKPVEDQPDSPAAETAQPAEEQMKAQAEDSDEDSKTDEHSDFLAELEKTFVKVRRGQFIKGVVVQVSDDEVCVNIGYKSDGIIKKDDLTADGNVSPAEMFAPGDEIEAEVVTLNDGEGNVRLSRKKIENQIKWKNLVENLDQEAIYECKVLKVIKGGVLSKLEGYDAFIPASQLSLKYVEDLSVFVGETLPVKIIDIDKRQKRFVLSHKEILKKQAEEEERKLFESFEKGAIVHGTVKRLTDFGAFVDIGGVDGLLHITDISWVRIKHPKDVLSENQEIDLKIINVDPEKKKISLGYKQLQPKPWDLAPEKYKVGDVVEGKVVRIAPFGAFVELEPTIDGLIHISQVANRRIEKVEDVLNLGDIVQVKVLEVNSEKKRISLSIRALLEEARRAEEEASRAERQEQRDQQRSDRPERSERAPREEGGYQGRRDRDREVDFPYVIPEREEATTSLADLFKSKLGQDDE